MKVSIITITYNSEKTIRETLQSVANQTYSEIEHVIIDGASKDNTLKIVNEFPHVAKVISEPDKGIYDAMNKGKKAATGTIVGILNSDDFYVNETIIQQVVEAFEKEKVDSIFGDIQFVAQDDLKKVVRYYSSKRFEPKQFAYGYMPAHPSFFAKKEVFDKYGLYKTDYVIAADYELLIRLLYVNKISYKYLPLLMVSMRAGGVSNATIKSRYILNKEIVRGCRENGIQTNLFWVGLKYFRKVFEVLLPKFSRS